VDYRKFLVAAGIALAAAAPATAAPITATKDATGKALILIPLTLTKTSDLDFGTAVESSTSGTITVPPDGNPPSATGGVTLVGTPGFRAQFAGAGSPGEQVDIFLAPPASIKDVNGDTMPISMNLDNNTVIIDSTRAFFVGVGGTVTVAANQPDGVYSGNFIVLAQYN